MNLDLNNINIPQHPFLRRSPMRNIMRHRVPPRRQPPIRPEKMTIPRLELHLVPFPQRFPLDGGIKAARKRLKNFPTSHAEKERLVRGGEVAVVTALEAYDGVMVGDELDGPTSRLGRPITVLGDGFLVFFSDEVLVVVAAETDDLGCAKEIHGGGTEETGLTLICKK